MRVRFHTVDVFAERAFGGNPLAAVRVGGASVMVSEGVMEVP